MSRIDRKGPMIPPVEPINRVEERGAREEPPRKEVRIPSEESQGEGAVITLSIPDDGKTRRIFWAPTEAGTYGPDGNIAKRAVALTEEEAQSQSFEWESGQDIQ